jgi:hypothetical protein
MHPNYDDTRRMLAQTARIALAQQLPEAPPEMIEAAIKQYMDANITDEFLFQDFERMAAEKRAKEAAEAAQWAKDQEAKKANAKVKRDHEDRLAREKAATAEAIEEAEVWEKRAKTLEGQFSALMTAQKTGGR